MKKLLLILALIPLLGNCAPPTTGQFLFQQKTASGPFDQFGVTPVTNQAFGWDGSKIVMLAPSGGVSWGGITGTLANQTDLQNALNLKLSLAGTLPLAGFGSITGTLPLANIPATIQRTDGTLALGSFGSVTGTLADARLSGNVQLKNGTLALAFFGSITGTLPTANLPTIPDGNLSSNVQLKNGTLGIAGFGSITGQVPSVNIADLSATYLTLSSAASTYQPLDGDLTALAALAGTNNIYYRSAANTWSSVSIGSGLAFAGGSLSATNSGTVTSVGLSVPSGFSVSGSPITTSGTLAVSLATQSAHALLVGPTTGSAATPTFRLLVAGDIPDISSTYLTTAAATAAYQPLDGDLTALAALSGTNSLYYRSAANTWSLVSFGSGVTFSGGTLSATGTGTVTSVGLTAPGIFSVGNSPIISNGDIALTLATQTANRVWAGPTTGSAATPSFRSLVAADIPDVSSTYLAVATAAATYQPLDGDLTALAALSGTNNIYYRSAANTWSSVTMGTGLTFSGGTLNGATVSSVALSAPAIFTVSGSPVTTSGTLAFSVANQAANLVWAGPTTGSAATPAFRSLVAADLPDISSTYLTVAAATAGYQPLDGDLTALAALAGTNNIYYRSAANTWSSVSIGSGLAFAGGSLSSTAVSSVALSLPAMFTVSGSPVTTTGTLSATLANQAANAFLGGPATGSAAAPTFRTLVAADLPDLTGTFITPAAVAAGYQPLDGDLTAIAALTGTDTIYRRSAANTWSPVTIAGNLVFSSGTLTGAGIVANTFTGAQVVSTNGVVSVPVVKLTGTWFSGGTSTTTKPLLLIEPTGTNSSTWNTGGTGLGVNAASGFTGRLIDLKLNNSSAFSVSSAGNTTILGTTTMIGAATVSDVLVALGTAFLNGGINGTASVGDATAGNVGEYVNSLISFGSAIALTTATPANVTSISLTAGDWDVEGSINFIATSATVTARTGTISTVSATLTADGSEVYNSFPTTTSTHIGGVTLARKRINVSSTTTIYLVCNCAFSAGSVAADGTINARRVR